MNGEPDMGAVDPDMGEYDEQQVCLRGHQITSSLKRHPERGVSFCQCGERTICACPACKTPIRGTYRIPGVATIGTVSVPKRCHSCGELFPWADEGSGLPGSDAPPRGEDASARAKREEPTTRGSEPPKTEGGPPVCFISYSWDSEEHKTWVEGLAGDLQRKGVRVRLDQWELTPGKNIPGWMEECVSTSDFVLLVCTPTFAKRANGALGGVGYEKNIVTGAIYGGEKPEKFIPLLRSGEHGTATPTYLKGKVPVDFRSDTQFDTALERLLRHVHDAPEIVPPPIGPKPTLLPHPKARGLRGSATIETDPPAKAHTETDANIGFHLFFSRNGSRSGEFPIDWTNPETLHGLEINAEIIAAEGMVNIPNLYVELLLDGRLVGPSIIQRHNARPLRMSMGGHAREAYKIEHTFNGTALPFAASNLEFTVFETDIEIRFKKEWVEEVPPPFMRWRLMRDGIEVLGGEYHLARRGGVVELTSVAIRDVRRRVAPPRSGPTMAAPLVLVTSDSGRAATTQKGSSFFFGFKLSNKSARSIEHLQVGVVVVAARLRQPLLTVKPPPGLSELPIRHLGAGGPLPVALQELFHARKSTTRVISVDRVFPFQDLEFDAGFEINPAGSDGLIRWGVWVAGEGIDPLARAFQSSTATPLAGPTPVSGPPFDLDGQEHER